jgi:autotransporter-associated beta strand protein
MLFHTGSAMGATTYTWDPGLTAGTSGPSGGSGVWDYENTTAWDLSGIDTTWSDLSGTSSTALFAAPSGTVTLNSSLGALEAAFSASGYTVAQGTGTGNPFTLTLNANGVKNTAVLIDATAAGVGSTETFDVPVAFTPSSSEIQTAGTVTFNSPVTVTTSTLILSGNTLGSFTGSTVTQADLTDMPATYVFTAGITGAFEIGGGNLVPGEADPVLAVWNDSNVNDPFGGAGSTTKVTTISYNGSIKAEQNMVIGGEVSLSGGTPDGLQDLSVNSSTLSGTGNITIGSNAANTNAAAGAPIAGILAFVNGNDNTFLINNLSGGAALTIAGNTSAAGSPATVMALSATQNGRMLTIGGSGTTIINAPIEDANQALASNTYTNSTLAKAGTGTLVINSTGSNYKGATQIENGTLQIGNTNSLPTGSYSTGNGTPGAVILGSVAGTTGTLDLNGNSQTLTSISLSQATAGVGLPATWSFGLGSPFVSLTGVTVPNSGLAVGETVTLASGLFDNESSTATITSIEDQGKTSAITKISLSSDASATASSAVTLGTPSTAGGIIGNSSSTSDATLTVNTVANTNTAWNTFGGVIQDTLGSPSTPHKMNLIVGGTSTLNLTGQNTYTGSTHVTGGAATLAVTGGALGPTNTLVDAFDALTLSNATLSYDLLSTGTTSTITDNGILNVAGTNIIDVFSTGVSLTPGGVYTIISDTANPFTDTPTSFEFSNLTTTETLVVGGTPYTLNLTDPVSTSVTLSVAVVPEPASMALVGIAGLGLLRRRKRA